MLASESWEAQVAHFSTSHRVVTFDLRGQGRSEHAESGLDLDNLAADAIELIWTLGLGPCHLVGFSMGTFVALRVAARRPELVRTLTLIGPSAEAEEPSNLPRYRLLIALVTVHAAIADSRFVAVPDTGHAVMIERPETFNALLESQIGRPQS